MACIIAIYLLNKEGLCHKYTGSLIEVVGVCVLIFFKQNELRYSELLRVFQYFTKGTSL